MSGLRSRLARALGATRDRFNRRLVQVDERQDALTREAVADLSERLAAIERRLAALEARDH